MIYDSDIWKLPRFMCNLSGSGPLQDIADPALPVTESSPEDAAKAERDFANYLSDIRLLLVK